MTISRSGNANVKIEMSYENFLKLQQMLGCQHHQQTCDWTPHGTTVRNFIVNALNAPKQEH